MSSSMFSFSNSETGLMNEGNFYLRLSLQNPWWGGESYSSSPLSSPMLPLQDSFSDSGPQAHQFQQGAYIQDNKETLVLHERCKALELQVVKLTTERDTLRAMFEQGQLPLANPLQLNSTQLSVAPTESNRPSATSHPNICFWEQLDFMKWLDSPGGLGSRHSKMAYIEDENGEAVSSRTIIAIRRVLRGGWSELVNCKIAPQSWGKLTASGRHLIHSFMENEFPLFKFAKNGWKLDHLATSTYPAWCRSNLDSNCNWKSSINTVKLEEEEDADDDAESNGDGNGSTKRNKRKYLPVTKTVKSEVVEKKRKVVPSSAILPLESVDSVLIPVSSPSLLNQPVDLPMIQAPSSPSPIPSRPHKSPITPASSESPLPLNPLIESSPSESAPLVEFPAIQVSSSLLLSQLLDPDLAELPSPLPSLPLAASSPLPASDVSSTCKENIPIQRQSIPSPKSVKIMITNPLSTLALCAANMRFPTPPPLPPPPPAAATLKSEPQKPNIDSNVTPATETTSSKAKKAKGKMRPSPTKNGRNLCAHRWLKQVRTNGTTDKFGVYYAGLTGDQRTAYDKEASELVATNKWDKTHVFASTAPAMFSTRFRGLFDTFFISFHVVVLPLSVIMPNTVFLLY
ncbi:hypothetical protein K503DRAFT_787613 [Rhizopogon vinicolor AM-OR11-026]|uniref:Uncharacterized protein n=1 Tax=Rhizopogon vinicolor AM-OR11-026 TaxID=1314800 RepID=A0A1B7MGR6_9AGAM|nr:hypothetical protein K503DRAFT_787613 [Rhizopogon vinicolor AM-OR11-026]